VKSQNHYAPWKLPTPELLDLAVIFSCAEVPGFVTYALDIKGTVLFVKLP
jgi:hypothetical protein